MRVKRCETCRFWEEEKGVRADGLCHRYPKSIAYLGGDYFPEANRNEWCGEHAKRDADDNG
jgi:hypothetical protein